MQEKWPLGGAPSAEPLFRRGLLQQILSLVRQQMEMEVAVLAEFFDGTEAVHTIEGDAAPFGLESEGTVLFQDGLSRRAFDEDPPGLIADVRSNPRVTDPVFDNVGAYIGTPVHLPDGRIWGSLFCLSSQARPGLDERDLRFLQGFARMAGEELERREREGEEHAHKVRRIRSLLAGGIHIALQPIFDLGSGGVEGVEALARFPKDGRMPELALAEAAEVGLGLDLQIQAARAAIALMPRLPEDLYLSVNVSPEAVMSSRFLELVTGIPGERLVVELTEHVEIDNYPLVNAALATLRGRGVRIAVDDLGAGFASLRHVLRLRPEIIKLDITLTRDIDTDPVRRALAASFISFAGDIGAAIVAEGIETSAEMGVLRSLGVPAGQGFYLAEPCPIEELTDRLVGDL